MSGVERACPDLRIRIILAALDQVRLHLVTAYHMRIVVGTLDESLRVHSETKKI